jgi:hypothetical protein
VVADRASDSDRTGRSSPIAAARRHGLPGADRPTVAVLPADRHDQHSVPPRVNGAHQARHAQPRTALAAVAAVVSVALTACAWSSANPATTSTPPATTGTGIPAATVDPPPSHGSASVDPPTATTPATSVAVDAAATAGRLSPATAAAKAYVYVPSNDTGTVTVLDQATQRTVRTLNVGKLVQHVVPSWDLSTLYALASGSKPDRPDRPDDRTSRSSDPCRRAVQPVLLARRQPGHRDGRTAQQHRRLRPLHVAQTALRTRPVRRRQPRRLVHLLPGHLRVLRTTPQRWTRRSTTSTPSSTCHRRRRTDNRARPRARRRPRCPKTSASDPTAPSSTSLTWPAPACGS